MKGLDLAKNAFYWLDSHAYDSVNGGYHSYLERNGTPITTPALGGSQFTPHEERIGLKDGNTTMDLVDAFSDLFRATSDSHVRKRLGELLGIVKSSMFGPPGVLYSHFTLDWKPAHNRILIGIGLQGSCILIKASKLMPDKLRSDLADIARSLVDTCLRDAWDNNDGGFYEKAIVDAGGIVVQERRKIWWVQAEGMRALLKQAFDESEEAKEYFGQFLRLWTFIDLKLIDHSRKGWYQFEPDAQNSRLVDAQATKPTRNAKPSQMWNAKAHQWKDASHEVRALIECIQMLKRAE
jgi:mannobiose 2-epimerase